MTQKVRITRNREADAFSAHIQADALMMSAFRSAVCKIWDEYTSQFRAAGHKHSDPSPLLVPPTVELIIALVERKVEAMRAAPQVQVRQNAAALDKLAKTAALFCVADDLLQVCLPSYRPLAAQDGFEVVTEATTARKAWWQFW